MLTLSLAAMADFITVVAAMLRSGASEMAGWTQPLPVAMALFGLSFLVASSIWAAKALSRAARIASTILRDPFPATHNELAEMFGSKHEDVVLDKLVETVQLHIARTLPSNGFSTYATVCLVSGTALAAASLIVPFVSAGQ